jgi:hypothetical protein
LIVPDLNPTVKGFSSPFRRMCARRPRTNPVVIADLGRPTIRSDYSSNGPSDREEFATTSALEVAIATAAKSGFKSPRTASGMATPL